MSIRVIGKMEIPVYDYKYRTTNFSMLGEEDDYYPEPEDERGIGDPEEDLTDTDLYMGTIQ